MRKTDQRPEGAFHDTSPFSFIRRVRLTTEADCTYAVFVCSGADRCRRLRSVQHASPSQLSFFAALSNRTVCSVTGWVFFTVNVKCLAVVSRHASENVRVSCQLEGGNAVSSTSAAPPETSDTVTPGSKLFVTEAMPLMEGISSVRTVTGSANS